MSDKLIVASALEAVLVLSGLVLLWLFFFSEKARGRAKLPWPLPFWNVPVYSYALAVVLVLGTGAMFRAFIFSLTKKYAPELTHTQGLGQIIDGLSASSGFILGAGAAWYLLKSSRFIAELTASTTAASTPPRLPWKHVPLASIAVFTILIVFKSPLSFVYLLLLEALSLPINAQESVVLFNSAQTSLETFLVLIWACVIAPISEELVFRAGLFRYLRGRIPRWIALTGTALLFTSLHFSIAALPGLFLFGIIIAIAYERTGRIAVPIIAHALYNLHTALSILAGVDPFGSLAKWLNS